MLIPLESKYIFLITDSLISFSLSEVLYYITDLAGKLKSEAWMC